MKESVEIAYSNVKYLMKYILNNDFFDKNFVHIHFTEGATPKDGIFLYKKLLKLYKFYYNISFNI